jgi:hypothetical protein
MFAQPSTEAFKPTTRLPEMADPDVGGLAGGDGRLVAGGEGSVWTAGDGKAGAGETGDDGVDAGRPAGDGAAGGGFRVLGAAWARGAWRIALRFVRTHMRFPRRTRQTIRVGFRFVCSCCAEARAGAAAATLEMIIVARR